MSYRVDVIRYANSGNRPLEICWSKKLILEIPQTRHLAQCVGHRDQQVSILHDGQPELLMSMPWWLLSVCQSVATFGVESGTHAITCQTHGRTVTTRLYIPRVQDAIQFALALEKVDFIIIIIIIYLLSIAYLSVRDWTRLLSKIVKRAHLIAAEAGLSLRLTCFAFSIDE